MKVVALDISTHCGWALLDDKALVAFGTLDAEDSKGDYPYNIKDLCENFAKTIFKEVVQKYTPDVIVIEETNRGKQRYSQKVLEFLHYAVLHEINKSIKTVYINTSEWRKLLNVKLTNKDKDNNKKVNQAKRSNKSKKELGLKGKVTLKHLSVRWANDNFKLNLLQKDNNAADAICLAVAYLNGAKLCDGK